MATITRLSTVITPAIAAKQLWRDDVDDITYRVINKLADGRWYVRCIGTPGKVWYDALDPETFVLDDLRLVN